MATVLGDFYALKAGGVCAVIAVIVMARLREHHPFAQFGPANQVTAFRALLVALVAGLVGERQAAGVAAGAAATGAIATALDGVDGWLARRTRMASAFGARFDMEIDALLILVLATLAWQYDKAGAWVLASGLLRYVFVAAGWMLPWMRRPLAGTVRGKAICVAQVAGLIVAVSPIVDSPASAWIAASTLGALCYSFVVDTVWLWRHRSDR